MSKNNEFHRNFAVIIGINNYQNGIRELKTAVPDALKLASIIQKQHEALKPQYQAQNRYEVQLFLNQRANLSQLKQLIADFQQGQITFDNEKVTVTEGDRILFYFAGHGIALDALENQEGPVGYLIPQDATSGDSSTYLPMQELHDALNALPCRHMLAILDCCFAGAFRWACLNREIVPKFKVYKERYDRFISDAAWQVITSAADDQKALDSLGTRGIVTDGNEDHSPFAKALFDALLGKVADFNQDGIITATEIYSYLRDQVEIVTETHYQRQTPSLCPLKKHDKGEFIFLSPDFDRDKLEDAPPLNVENNPYRGLSSYDENDSNLFFGREEQIQKLYEKVVDNKQQLTLVLGASGTGKSSLVKAGLIPKLRENDKTWSILPPFRPGESPLKSLNNILESVKQLSKQAATSSRLFTPVEETLGNWFKNNPQAKLLVVIDQFEELITLCKSDKEQEQEQFLKLIKNALTKYSNNIHIVITLRLDFEAQFQTSVLEDFWKHDTRFVVPPMSQNEFREAIEKPALEKVLYFKPPSLVDELINEVVQMPGALPLLSFTLSELYLKYLGDRTRDNRALTEDDYEDLGRVVGSITNRANQEYEKLVAENSKYKDTVRRVMLRMISLQGGELARRQVHKSELVYSDQEENKRVQTVIKCFSEARLIVEGSNSEGEAYLEPAHDALVCGWNQLLAWVKEEKNLTLQRRLTPAALEWKSQQQARFLWNADPYLDVLQKEVFNSPNNNWLNQLESEFVQQSVNQKNFNIRRNCGIVTVALLLLSGATIFAIKNAIDAQNQLLESNSSLADSLFTSGRKLDALIKATETGKMLKKNTFSVKEDSKIKVLTTLQKVVYGLNERNRLEGKGMNFSTVSFSPDGKIIASDGNNGTIKLWYSNGKLFQTLDQPQKNNSDTIFKVIFSNNGQTLISASQKQGIKIWQRQLDGRFNFYKSIPDQDGMMGLALSLDDKTIATAGLDSKSTIKLWSLDGKLLKTLQGHSDRVNDLSFSADGRTIASASADKTIKLWRAKDAKLKLLKNIPESSQMFAVRFINSETIAYAGANRVIKLWNLKEGKPKEEFPVRHSADISRLVLSHDGKMIASASKDRTVNLWSLDGKLLHTLQGHENDVTDVTISHDSKMIASVSTDNTLRIWSLDNVAPTLKGSSLSFSPNSQMIVTGKDKTINLWQIDGKLQKKFPGHKDFITKVSFSPDGKIIATASADKTVKLWDLDGKLLHTLQEHKGSVTSVSFSPDSKIIASGSLDQTVKLWDLHGKLLHTLEGHKDSVTSVSFSPDSKMIASGSRDSTVRLWDLDGKLLHTITGHTKAILDVSFSPNGKMIASASEDKTVMLWHLHTILWHLNVQQTKVFKFNDNVFRVKFSPNSQTLASASEKEIKLWNLDSYLSQDFPGENVSDISFSPDGKTFASSDLDKVIVLNLDLDKLLERSCSWLHDYLTYHKDNQDSRTKLCNRSSYLPNRWLKSA
jgi:WD40 repeat protein